MKHWDGDVMAWGGFSLERITSDYQRKNEWNMDFEKEPPLISVALSTWKY